MTTNKIEVHASDPNIFAELGLPDADANFLKAQIVAELYRPTSHDNLTQAKADAQMAISQPEVSRLFKGNFREYSVERLMGFLTAFDQDVDITARPRGGVAQIWSLLARETSFRKGVVLGFGIHRASMFLNSRPAI